MHSQTTINQFIELRAQGLRLNRIADQLSVSKRTLVEWNREHQETIASLQALELEALHEKVLASHEHELTRLVACQSKIDEELAKRSLETIPTDKLLRLSLLVRHEIRALCKPYRARSASHAQSSPIKVNQAQNFSSPVELAPSFVGDQGSNPESAPPISEHATCNLQPSTENQPQTSSFENPENTTSYGLQTTDSPPPQDQPSHPSTLDTQPLFGEHCLHCGEPLPALLPDGARLSSWCAACSSPIAAPPGLSIRELCHACSATIPVHGYNNNRLSSRCSECDTVLLNLEANSPLKWLPPNSKFQAHASSAI